MKNTITIKVLTKETLADSPFQIKIGNLPKNKKIKIRLILENYYCINAPMNLDSNIFWESEALFKSDYNGQIDLAKTPALSGAYQGVERMGLFFNAKPSSLKKEKLPTNIKDIPYYKNFNIKIEVYDENEELLGNKLFKRYFQSQNIKSKTLFFKHSQSRFFYHDDNKKRATIMVISGSEGRIEKAQNIAQLLASRGFNSLAIAYFSLDGLPKNLEKIPIEAIEEGIEYLESSLFVDIDNIGIYGRSKGAELALLATSKLNGIKCLVLNSPSYIALEGIRRWKNSHSSSWSFRGKELPYQKFRLIDFFKRICSKNTILKHINPQSIINIKHCDIALLMIASKTDEVWQAEFSTHKIQEACSKNTTCKVNLYEETGHMLTIGYQPNNRYSKKNSSALLEESVHSWEESINFFKKHLKSEFADKQKNQ